MTNLGKPDKLSLLDCPVDKGKKGDALLNSMGRFRPPGGIIRSFGDQIEEICMERGILKQDIAEKAEISPAQLSHYLKYGCSLRMIERISKALDLPPSYFDVYVAENSANIIMMSKDLLEVMRSLHNASDNKRRTLLKKFAA